MGQGKELKARIIWPEPSQVLDILLGNSYETALLWAEDSFLVDITSCGLTVFQSFLAMILEPWENGCDIDVLCRTTGLRVYG